MKLRLMPDSIRLRLNRTDVTRFAGQGEIIEGIELPGPTVLRYGLHVSNEFAQGTARFEKGELMVTVPENHAKNWMSNNKEVGLYYQQERGTGKSLRLIIEKDFQCIDGPPEEVDPAGYPNPLANSGINPAPSNKSESSVP